MVMMLERGDAAGTGKAYHFEPLHLKDRSMLPSINSLMNTLQSCDVGMHTEINLKLVVVRKAKKPCLGFPEREEITAESSVAAK